MGHKKGDRVYVKVSESNGYYVVIKNIIKNIDDSNDTIREY